MILCYNKGNEIKTRVRARVTSHKDVTLMTTPKYTSDIPYGYCHCGCGQKTNIILETNRVLGRIKGEPFKFVFGHAMRLKKPVDLDIKFWPKVNKQGSIPAHCPELGNCWEWIGSLHKQGYGNIGLNKKSLLAHRVSWEMTHGLIPEGLGVLHKCDNPKCVRPDHLFLGTQTDNMRDMVSKGRHPRLSTSPFHAKKITDAQVIEIRQRYANGGITMKSLASQYGISAGHVCNLVNNRNTKR